MRTFYTILYGCLLLLSSCYDEPTLPGKSILLTQGTWQLVRWTSTPAYRHTYSNGTQATSIDLFDFSLPCRHDDEYVFEINPLIETGTSGTYVYQEGNLSCGSEKIRESNTWFFSEEPSGIKIYFELPGSEPFNYKIRKIYSIEELTQNSLTFGYKIQVGSTVYTWRETYKRK